MIIQSVTLKNIKSYGEGAAGDGITVHFQPGINRVAGRNGHGKTTLIEAVGYALFFCEPDFAERFTLPTYFLRSGKKEGEISVVFTHDGLTYRVERGVGQSRIRSKVIQESDGSTCAMDDAEVSSFLCRLLGFKEQKQLSDLFANLIGIKQGRLTRPFDSAPSAAKAFFEPLLDVAIFRESASRLSEAQGHFRQLHQEQDVKLATQLERIRERADSGDKVQNKELQVGAVRKALEKARKQRDAADAHKQICERKQTAFLEAKQGLEQAGNQQELAAHRRQTHQQRVDEAATAAQATQRHQPGYQAYVKAEERLRVLHARQKERSALLEQRAAADKAVTGAEARRAGSQKQAAAYLAQRDERARQAETLAAGSAEQQKRLEATEPDFEKFAKSTATARRTRDTVESWQTNLQEQVSQNLKLYAILLKEWDLIRKWDPRSANQARTEEQRLEKQARSAAQALAKAEEARATLALQLEQIGGGVCPFLKEKCRQFDPKAVQADLNAREKELRQAREKHQQTELAWATARKNCEKLAQQESAIAHSIEVLGEKTASFVQVHNRLLPDSIKKHWATLEEYLTNPTQPLTPSPPPEERAGVRRPPALPEMGSWTATVLEDCWEKPGSVLKIEFLARLANLERDLPKTAEKALAQLLPLVEARFAEFDEQQLQRVRQAQDLKHAQTRLKQLADEKAELRKKMEASLDEAGRLEREARNAEARRIELDAALKPFADLEHDLAEQNVLKDKHAEAHKLYLQAQRDAASLADRQAALKESILLHEQSQEQVRRQQEVLRKAESDFNETALKQARETAAAAEVVLAMETQRLKDAERDLQLEKERLRQWKEACAERDRIQTGIGRLKAAGELARLAGKVLKATAPAVAQHLCSRIAANAQRIFNQLNVETIELEWNAEPQYGLRIIPGDRRFAMLSGGEQTKLALAMTLAMIQEFSGLRFAVFDEPTYAVDAESRPKLADAILEAQKAAGLEQLIVVSHDDAFEGKIESVVMLDKSAGRGTELAIGAGTASSP